MLIYLSIRESGLKVGFNSNIETIKEAYDKLISSELKNMSQSNPDLPKYNCQVEINPITQRVYKVVFTKK